MTSCDLTCELECLHRQCNVKLKEESDRWSGLNQRLTERNMGTLALRLPTSRNQMAECLFKQEVQVDREEFVVQILDICHKFSDLHREWLPGDKYDVTQTILEQEERRQRLKRRQSSDKKEEKEEEGKNGGGGEECEKDKIMTEKEDRTVSGLAQSRDLFESQEEDNLKRSQYCVCNNILCDCDENPESKSLLDNC